MSNNYNHIVFFDGVCGLCQAWVRFLVKKDKSGKFYFSSLQSDFANSRISHQENLKNIDSIIYYANGRFYSKSSAALRILKDIGGIWILSFPIVFIPKFIRDYIYDSIAKNRYKWFGKSGEVCELLNKNELARVIEDIRDVT